jgi:hypothetical protein
VSYVVAEEVRRGVAHAEAVEELGEGEDEDEG